MTDTAVRAASAADASPIHDLVMSNLEAGRLLPRPIDDVNQHVSRFVVAEQEGRVVGCAELAPLSTTVAEIRSLVVVEALRGRRIGSRLVRRVAADATVGGYATLCAFTHDPSHFVRLGFTIVPHVWMPEKIARDCTACRLFRRCGQYAVRLPLARGVGAAPRRPNIERLRLPPLTTSHEHEQPELTLA